MMRSGYRRRLAGLRVAGRRAPPVTAAALCVYECRAQRRLRQLLTPCIECM
jgi:hypothetical protein